MTQQPDDDKLLQQRMSDFCPPGVSLKQQLYCSFLFALAKFLCSVHPIPYFQVNSSDNLHLLCCTGVFASSHLFTFLLQLISCYLLSVFALHCSYPLFIAPYMVLFVSPHLVLRAWSLRLAGYPLVSMLWYHLVATFGIISYVTLSSSETIIAYILLFFTSDQSLNTVKLQCFYCILNNRPIQRVTRGCQCACRYIGGDFTYLMISANTCDCMGVSALSSFIVFYSILNN